MANGITNPTYAGRDGLGIVNDLDGLETAIQDASGANKRWLINKIDSENGTAYFISSASKTERAVRNIKAFFFFFFNGRTHDATVKDALVALANKKAADGSATQYQRIRARSIAQSAVELDGRSISGNAALAFKALIVSAERNEQSRSPDFESVSSESHDYESLDESSFEFPSTDGADRIPLDYLYPTSLPGGDRGVHSDYEFSPSYLGDDIEGDYSDPDSFIGVNSEATATTPERTAASFPIPEITLVGVEDQETGLTRESTQDEIANFQRPGDTSPPTSESTPAEVAGRESDLYREPTELQSSEQLAKAFANGESLNLDELALAKDSLADQLRAVHNEQIRLEAEARQPGGAIELRSRQYDTTNLSPDFARQALQRSSIGQEADFERLTQRNSGVREHNQQVEAGIVKGQFRVEINPLSMTMSRGAEVLASRIDAQIIEASRQRAEQIPDITEEQLTAVVQSEFRNINNYKTGAALLDDYILAQLPDILTDEEHAVLADYQIAQRALSEERTKLQEQLNEVSTAITHATTA